MGLRKSAFADETRTVCVRAHVFLAGALQPQHELVSTRRALPYGKRQRPLRLTSLLPCATDESQVELRCMPGGGIVWLGVSD